MILDLTLLNKFCQDTLLKFRFFTLVGGLLFTNIIITIVVIDSHGNKSRRSQIISISYC